MKRDLRFAFRMLWRRPGLTAAVVLTLALGIGATTAMFSVVQRVLLQALPVPQPQQLVLIHEEQKRSGALNVSWPDYLDWRAQTHSFSALAAIGFGSRDAYTTRDGNTATLYASSVSASLFPLLGARFVLGRNFTPQEDSARGAAALIISSRFWKKALGGNTQVVGSTLAVGGTPVPIIGVVQVSGDDMPWSADAYVALGLNTASASFLDRGNHPGLRVVGRMKPGVTLAAARADLGLVMRRLAIAYPQTNQDESAVVLGLAAALNGSYRSELWLLLGAVGLVLLLACANLAHLLLARASGRSREFAIRNAMGASRGDLLRQSAWETALLAALGSGLGILLAWALVPVLVHWAPYPVPRLQQAQLNGAVVVFAVGAAVVAALLMGLAPALEAAGANLSQRMKASGHSGLRAGLLVAEVALAVVVVAGAGLLARSLQQVLAVNPGFAMHGIITLEVSHELKGAIPAYESAMERARSLPGVAAVGAVYSAPLHGFSWTTPYEVGGQPAVPAAERPWAELNFVMPGYFQAIGAHLASGRHFSQSDGAGAPLVAIINETLAHKIAPGASAVGKRVFVADDGQWRTVVGVVGDLRQNSLSDPAYPSVLVPLAQYPYAVSMVLTVRTAGDAAVVMRELRKAIPTMEGPELMATALGHTLVRRDFLVELMSGFGLLALLLAALGIYAITAQRVSEQVREMGVRSALGATPGELARAVLGASLRWVMLGLAIGLAAAFYTGRLWGHLLFGVGAADPVALVGTCVLLLVVAVAACLGPAWRAARTDPMTALRAE